MSKAGKQRTKGFVKPSTSGRAAELLAASGVTVSPAAGFIGFDAFREGSSNDLKSLDSLELDSGSSTNLDPEISVAFRQMLKKDTVTKLKALKTVQALFSEKEESELLIAMQCYPRLYNRLALDGNFRVREAAHESLSILAQRVGRQFSQVLRSVFPNWLMGMQDSYTGVAKTARNGFQQIFPPAKRSNVYGFCKEEIVKSCHNILNVSVSQEKIVGDSEEETAVDRQLRLVTCSFLALAETQIEIPPDHRDWFSKAVMDQFLNLKRFWKNYGNHENVNVKSGFFQVLCAVCSINDQCESDLATKLVPAVMNNLDDVRPPIAQHTFPLLLLALHKIKNFWELTDINKAFFPKLKTALASGCGGSARVIGPTLLPLLSMLPINPQDGMAILEKFMTFINRGCCYLVQTATSNRADSTAIIQGYCECFEFMLKHDACHVSEGSHLLTVNCEELLTLIQLCLTSPTQNCASILQPVLQLLAVWSKMQTELIALAFKQFYEKLQAFLVESLVQDSNIANIGTFLTGLKPFCEEKTSLFSVWTESSTAVLDQAWLNYIDSKDLAYLKLCAQLTQDGVTQTPLANHSVADLLIGYEGDQLQEPQILAQILLSGTAGPFDTANIGSALRNDLTVVAFVEQCLRNRTTQQVYIDSEAFQELVIRCFSVVGAQGGLHVWLVLSDCLRMRSKDGRPLLSASVATEILCRIGEALRSTSDAAAPVALINVIDCFVDLHPDVISTTSSGELVLLRLWEVLLRTAAHSQSTELAASIRSVLRKSWNLTAAQQNLAEKVDILFATVQAELLHGTEENTAYLVECLEIFLDAAEWNSEIINKILNSLNYVGLDCIESCRHALFTSNLIVLAQADSEHLPNDEAVDHAMTQISFLSKFLQRIVEHKPNGEFKAIPGFWQGLLGVYFGPVLAKLLRPNSTRESSEAVNPLMSLVLEHFEATDVLSLTLEIMQMSRTEPKADKRLLWSVLAGNELICGLDDLEDIQDLLREQLLVELSPGAGLDLANSLLIAQFLASHLFVKDESLVVQSLQNVGSASTLSRLLLYLGFAMQTGSSAAQKEVAAFWMSVKDNLDDELLLSGDIMSCSRESIAFNVALADLFTALIPCLAELQSDLRDFIACSLVTWLQSIAESDFENLDTQVLSYHVTTCFCQLAEHMAALDQSKPEKTLEHSDSMIQFATDWSGFFLNGCMDILLPLFYKIAERPETYSLEAARVSLAHAVTFATPDNLMAEENLGPVLLWPELDTRHYPVSLQTILLHLCPLLSSTQSHLQLSAFKLLSKLLSRIVEAEQQTAEQSEDQEPSSSTDDTTTKITTFNSVEEESEVPLFVSEAMAKSYREIEYKIVNDMLDIEQDMALRNACLTYFLAWLLFTQYCKGLKPQILARYSSHLRSSKAIERIILTLFCVLPETPSAISVATSAHANYKGVLKSLAEKAEDGATALRFAGANIFTDFPRVAWKEDLLSVSVVERLACHLYHNLLRTFPALIRQWWNNQPRKTAQMIDRFTAKHISPLICTSEIASLTHANVASPALKIISRPTTREVIAIYALEDMSMELAIALPENHPLGPVAVDSAKRVGVNKEHWRKWMLQLSVCLMHQNGSLSDGLLLWKGNVDRHLEGVEDCMICMMSVHATNYQLPKISCKQCKKKFHASCLYKWFNTSNNTSCPMCRTSF